MADIQEITVGNQTFEFPTSMSEDEMQRLINLELQKPNTNQASEAQNNLVPTGLNTQINNTVDQTQNMLSNVLRQGNAERGSRGIPDPIVSDRPNTDRSVLTRLADRLHNRDTYGGIGTAIGGAGAVIAGNIGPQAFTPEEIITVPAGMIAGETAGENIYDTIEQLRGNKKPPTVREAVNTLGKDLSSSAKWTLGSMAIPGVGSAIKRGLTGETYSSLFKRGAQGKLVGEAEKELYNAAKNIKIPLSIGEVTESALAKTYLKVAGIFPWIGKSFIKQTGKTRTSLEKYNDDILNTLAPNATIANLGVDVFNAAKNTYKSFRSLSAKHYDKFKNLAGGLKNSNIIQLGNIKNYVREIKQSTQKYNLGGKKPKVIEANTGDPILSFLETITKIKGSINPLQYRNLQREINKLMNKGVVEGWDIKRLRDAKEALEKDFSVLLMPSNLSNADQIAFKAVAEAHKNANNFYSKGIKLFDQPAAKPFQRVDKNIFRAGFEKGGTLNADELLPKVLNLNSPQAVKDLKALVDPDLFKTAAKNWLDDVWRGASEARLKVLDKGSNQLTYDPTKIAASLGITGKNQKAREESVKYLAKQAGVNYYRLKDFLKVSRNYEGVQIPNVSNFVARRVLLGGAATIGSLFTGNPHLLLIGITLGKFGTRLLSSPKKLDEATNILKSTTPKVSTYIGLGKILDFIAEGPEISSKEKEVLLQVKQEAMDIAKEMHKNRFNKNKGEHNGLVR